MTNHRDQTRQRSSLAGVVPILLIATLVFVITDRNRSDASDRPRNADVSFSDTAFLGGITRRYESSNFRGGEAEAFLGGIDLDFRNATMEGDEATIDVTAVMGGVKIRVPHTWNVVNRVGTILGGTENRTVSRSSNKRLIIDGTVLMGGLEIQN
jgi:predicted membrane protein